MIQPCVMAALTAAVFFVAAASIPKLPVDGFDQQPPGVIGLNRVRQFKQFPLGGLGCGEGAILFEFHFWRFLSYLARASRIAVALRAHQTQEFGGVNLANIAEMLGYSDDPVPML